MKKLFETTLILLVGLLPAYADVANGEEEMAGHGHAMAEMMPEQKVETFSLTADGGLDAVNQSLADRYGIRAEGVRRTADGTMLDYRYRIENAELAGALHGEHERPSILHQRSGLIFQVPFISKVGSLKQNAKAPKVNRTYVILFSNPGRIVQSGDLVTIEQGPIRIADIPVE